MNDDILNLINETINTSLKLFDIRFEKDLVMISLVQYYLNSLTYYKDIQTEDIEHLDGYLNFHLKYEDISDYIDYIREHNDEIPFIFKYINIIINFDLGLIEQHVGDKILNVFETILNGNQKLVSIKLNKHSKYIESIKLIYVDKNIKDFDTNIDDLHKFCLSVEDAIGLRCIDRKETEIQSVEKILDELNSYIGLKRVKEEIDSLVKLIEVRKKRVSAGLKNPTLTYHLCFLGNPGTGKTTVARIVGKLYRSLGILTNGQLIEVGRQDLVAGYVGQTAIKTKEVIDKAKGGILFIDEAYSLTNKSENDFGLEAIEVLLKEMEDKRDDFVVIVAGYDDLMNDFLESNPGLKSRFNTFIHFEDYNNKELVDIIEMQCNKNDYVLSDGAKQYLVEYLERIISYKDKNFSNARFARNLFENAIKKQSIRILENGDTNDDVLRLKTLNREDFVDGD